MQIQVLASVVEDPHMSLNNRSTQLNISKSSLHRILKKMHKFHPYKMILVQMLGEDDFERRSEYCDWFIGKNQRNPQFAENILYTDECTFHSNGMTCTQNMRYWAQVNILISSLNKLFHYFKKLIVILETSLKVMTGYC